MLDYKSSDGIESMNDDDNKDIIVTETRLSLNYTCDNF